MAADAHPEGSEAAAPSEASPRVAATDLAAILALLLLGGSWTWWALKYGAFYGTVLYPGTLLLAIGLLVLLRTAPWRANLALSRSARLTLWSLIALASWSLASALWSPTPDIAVADAQRILAYALAFALGLWACALLGRRMELSLLPVMGAAAIVGLVTVAALLLGDDATRFLDEDGTLEYPLGYRNATAAFFMIGLWPAIGLASSVRVPAALRIAAFMTATLCIEWGIICQSRGSIVGTAVALLVFLVFTAHRVRSFVWLMLAAGPAIPCYFAAEALFDAAKDNPDLVGVADEMNSAALAVLTGLLVALPIAFFTVRMALLDSIGTPAWATKVRIRLAFAAAVAVAGVGIVMLIGNPVTWGGDRADEFLAGEPDRSLQQSRFTLNAGSNRSDLWPVALEAFSDDPVFGEGGGGFQYRYTRDRTAEIQLALDAHSVWLEQLSELGAVGLLLFMLVVAGAFAGALRARRLGPAAGQLACTALAAGAYWLAHSSFDWFWAYPAVTAPVLALLGAAAAPAVVAMERSQAPRGARIAVGLAVALFALSTIPPYLSERLNQRALASFRADTEQAYSDLELARTLNPLSDQPIVNEALIARELGDRQRAIAVFREAARKRPEEYANYFFLADLYRKTDPAEARSELAVARELNPLSARIDKLGAQIEASQKRLERSSAGR